MAALLPQPRLEKKRFSTNSQSDRFQTDVNNNNIESCLECLQPEANKTTPMTAAMKAFEVLGVTKIALVTPYIGAVNDILISYIQSHGPYQVNRLVSFNLIHDSDVASVSCDSIVSAAKEVVAEGEVDVVFISCTSLRTVGQVITRVEAETGVACTSSNSAMAWHIARMLGCNTDLSQTHGKLWGTVLR